MAKNVRKSDRRSVFVVVRLSPKELERLKERERREGRDRSDILREAVPPPQD